MKSNKTQENHLDLNTHIDNYLKNLAQTLKNLNRAAVVKATEMLSDAYKNGHNVFIIGNGGSAANASHLACDLSKGTLERVYDESEKRFRVYSLTDNVALMTAYANDTAYDEIFVQQMRNLVLPNDIIIVLSGSGNSINLVKALIYTKKCGAKSIGFLGFKTGGLVARLTDVAIIADSNEYGPCEDLQLILDHIITSWLSKLHITIRNSS
jgi:D-sedoheptulose 7-phosphate isomerase